MGVVIDIGRSTRHKLSNNFLADCWLWRLDNSFLGNQQKVFAYQIWQAVSVFGCISAAQNAVFWGSKLIGYRLAVCFKFSKQVAFFCS